MTTYIENEMAKLLKLAEEEEALSVPTKLEIESSNKIECLIKASSKLASAATDLESIGKEGESKFLWKMINAAQLKIKAEMEGPQLKKEASVKEEDSYQKYCNLLK